MNELTQIHCSPIDSHSIRLTDEEINKLDKKLAGWSITHRGDEPRLEKTYKFENFSQALVFTNLVANEAEKEDHHPALLTEWAKVTVSWWTHKIKGLHLNDFIMAAKTDLLYHTDSNGIKE